MTDALLISDLCVLCDHVVGKCAVSTGGAEILVAEVALAPSPLYLRRKAVTNALCLSPILITHVGDEEEEGGGGGAGSDWWSRRSKLRLSDDDVVER